MQIKATRFLLWRVKRCLTALHTPVLLSIAMSALGLLDKANTKWGILISGISILDNCLKSIYQYGYDQSKQSVIIENDIFECLYDEEDDFSDLLADGGRRLKDWLQLNDIVHRENGNYIINQVACDCLISTGIVLD